jgi:hypothetical protein
MNTKYKFVQTTGCTAFDFTVNDESIADLSEEKQSEIIDYLLIKLKEEYSQGSILIGNIVEMFQYDDYEYDDYECEQCGDRVSSTTWNI